MTEKTLRYELVKTMIGWCGGKKGGREHIEILNTYNSHKPLPRGYAVKPNDAYCATTVSAAAIKCGIGDKTIIECSCSELINQAKERGWWVEDDAYAPKPADLCLYDWGDSGKGDDVGAPDHVGMVIAVGDEGFTVAEGNVAGGAIGFRFMERDGRYIRGFICPNYASMCGDAPQKGGGDVMTGKEIYDALNDYLVNEPLPDWATDELEEAKSLGITDGTAPEMFATRAQAAIMAKRAAKANK